MPYLCNQHVNLLCSWGHPYPEVKRKAVADQTVVASLQQGANTIGVLQETFERDVCSAAAQFC